MAHFLKLQEPILKTNFRVDKILYSEMKHDLYLKLLVSVTSNQSAFLRVVFMLSVSRNIHIRLLFRLLLLF